MLKINILPPKDSEEETKDRMPVMFRRLNRDRANTTIFSQEPPTRSKLFEQKQAIAVSAKLKLEVLANIRNLKLTPIKKEVKEKRCFSPLLRTRDVPKVSRVSKLLKVFG